MLLPQSPNYIIIGDVHGAIEELKELLRKLEPDIASGSHLIFLGDYIDRGPEGPAVVKLVRRLVESGYATALMGNHEEKSVRALKRGEAVDFDPNDVDFLANLPVVIAIPGGLVLHGGISPYVVEQGMVERIIDRPFSDLKGKDKKLANKILRTRKVSPETGKMLPLGSETPESPFWTEVYDGRYGVIYFGHEMHGVATKFAVPLDGGAAFGGVLRAAYHDPASGQPVRIVEVPTRAAYAKYGFDPAYQPVPKKGNPPHCALCLSYA